MGPTSVQIRPGPAHFKLQGETIAATYSVRLPVVQLAAKKDPSYPTGEATNAHAVKIVEHALAAEGLLSKKWVDGSFGTKTIAAYAAWQRHLGYSGRSADGIPAHKSLVALGKRHDFWVINE